MAGADASKAANADIAAAEMMNFRIVGVSLDFFSVVHAPGCLSATGCMRCILAITKVSKIYVSATISLRTSVVFLINALLKIYFPGDSSAQESASMRVA
jgi:hypothetical protein